VTGRLLANDARMGKVTYTIQDPIDGSTQFCNVEQLAIHHYQTQEDFTYGIHSEGAVIRTLIGLLFLDIIYTLPTPDLLIDIFQTEPLDFQTDAFYKSRQSQIDERIAQFQCEEVMGNIPCRSFVHSHFLEHSRNRRE
jgi:Fanconi-associated nuclease 1